MVQGVSPRGTDWSLALVVALLAATGVGTAFAGAGGDAWVFAAHGAGGFALAALLCWKLRRVAVRLRRPSTWDRRVRAGLLALALVSVTLVSGWLWSAGLGLSWRVAGYNLLNLHFVAGVLLSGAVLGHALLRARRPRRADLAGRRQFLLSGGVAGGAFLVWWLQGPLLGAAGLRGAGRRFTGSYETASFEGNEFPTTSWVSDSPRQLPPDEHRVRLDGDVARALDLRYAELDAGDELTAVLDCTGGFVSEQRWAGVRIGTLLDRARPGAEASHVRVISHTGYRYSFDIDDARSMLLATHVGGEPISHGHGAPVRLVAPGHRGFQWVKWVVAVEVHDGPDPGAFASTIWSSYTPEGRGED